MQQQLVLPGQQSNRYHEAPVEQVLEPACKGPKLVPIREANAAVSAGAFLPEIGLVETGVPEIGAARVSVA
jgi:hypothetical protein